MTDQRVLAELHGTVIHLAVAVGQWVGAGSELALIESMKMHHPVLATAPGRVARVAVAVGATVATGDLIVELVVGEPDPGTADGTHPELDVDAAPRRTDLDEVGERKRFGLDSARSAAVDKRSRLGKRTARHNLDDLLDPGSFVEYGAVVIAAQRRRRSVEELIAATPADGLIGGIGTINGAPVVAVSYDYMVLAGTQGLNNHRKKDRLFELAERLQAPVVLFGEGGGGRPGDTDHLGVSGLDCLAFLLFAELSASVPLVGIASGYCFAGNAALLGCCDVIIATADTNLGMGGPAMIEGGGLGVFAPGQIGPIEVQRANGVVDVVVEDEAAAVAVAKQYLGYFTERTRETWTASDQLAMRTAIPVDRKRAYDVRGLIDAMFDEQSVLELRAEFGRGMITALARIEGRAVGVIANNPTHRGGAIDSDGADKAARFLQLCDAFDIPVVTLVDTPGMMVGPEAETTALVRHCSRLFVTGANISVPMVSVVLRKCYGLGAQAMMGGSTKAPLACVAWPTGEFGGMGLEGAVRLGYRRELEAIADPDERAAAYDEMVERMYEHGKALNVASHFEIDDVIDPADTRRWLAAVLAASSAAPRRPSTKRRPNIDTW